MRFKRILKIREDLIEIHRFHRFEPRFKDLPRFQAIWAVADPSDFPPSAPCHLMIINPEASLVRHTETLKGGVYVLADA